MSKKWLRWTYGKIVPKTTQWLPRYYTALRLIGEGLTLDASCGTGDTTIGLKKRGVRAIGINISREGIALARKKTQKERLTLLVCKFQKLVKPQEDYSIASTQEASP